MRRAARVDLNAQVIILALRQCGWQWVDLSRVGQGCPDGAASRAGVVRFVEVKGPRGKLTPEQVAFHARHPVTVLRSVDDAVALR